MDNNNDVAYEAPAVEIELSSEDLDREVLYAGNMTQVRPS